MVAPARKRSRRPGHAFRAIVAAVAFCCCVGAFALSPADDEPPATTSAPAATQPADAHEPLQRLPGVTIYHPSPRQGTMTAVPSIERSNVSFASLLRMLNNRSISEKLRNRLLDSDLGKQVTWSGYVRQVRTNIGDKDRAHLLVISPQKERSWDVALCWFDAGRENKIRDLPVGDPVTVTGVLSLDATGGPALDGCRLERTATAPAVNPRRR